MSDKEKRENMFDLRKEVISQMLEIRVFSLFIAMEKSKSHFIKTYRSLSCNYLK